MIHLACLTEVASMRVLCSLRWLQHMEYMLHGPTFLVLQATCLCIEVEEKELAIIHPLSTGPYLGRKGSFQIIIHLYKFVCTENVTLFVGGYMFCIMVLKPYSFCWIALFDMGRWSCLLFPICGVNGLQRSTSEFLSNQRILRWFLLFPQPGRARKICDHGTLTESSV